MPSAWHTPDDPREFSDPPLVVPCDSPDCSHTVTLATEDWHDNDPYYCHACVLAVIAAPHPVERWPEDLWF
jgi:hypothetical protein